MKRIAAFLFFLAALLPAQSGKSWLTANRHDGGKVFLGTRLTHSFSFSNPTSKEVRITNLTDNCKCSGSWLVAGGREFTGKDLEKKPFLLPAGGRARVKLLLDMTGIRGTKEATASLFIAGKKKEHLSFYLRATGEVYFRVKRAGLSLGDIKWGGSRDFSFAVYAIKSVGDWNIKQYKSLPPGVNLSPPVKSMVDGQPTYTFKGSIGPLLEPGKAGGVIRLQTDFRDRILEVNLTARVLPPMLIKPRKSVCFGLVKRRRGKSRQITIESLDRTYHLKHLKAHFVKLSHPTKFFAITQAQPSLDGKIVITVTVKPGAPEGMLKGFIELELNHPRQQKKLLSFSAYVR